MVFRGSLTPLDWFRDFLAIPHELADHPQLGDVHAGFAIGMDDALGNLLPRLRNSVYVTGHSLGAARATIFSGLLMAIAKPPVARVVFGEPRSGCARLSSIVRRISRNASYRNVWGGSVDLVTTVPTDPPYKRATPLTDVHEQPKAFDSWGLLARHHLGLYAKAVGVEGIDI